MRNKIEIRFKNVEKSKTFNNIVKNFDLGKKSVFDIGCSYGEFLVHFGPGSIGLTIVQEEVDYGKSRGLDVRYGNIESEEININEKFDVIFANNILEHLFSPHNFLLKIKKFLKPDGFLILGVPCFPKIVSLLRLNKFRGSLAVSHVNFFTKDTLIKTTEKAGWKIISIRGFHFKNKILDRFLNIIYPHFYLVAKPEENFHYHEKKIKELAGYKK